MLSLPMSDQKGDDDKRRGKLLLRPLKTPPQSWPKADACFRSAVEVIDYMAVDRHFPESP